MYSYTIFLLVMKTYKIYSLSNFQIYSLVLLTVVTLLYIASPGLINSITGSVYLSTLFIHFCLSLTPCF